MFLYSIKKNVVEYILVHLQTEILLSTEKEQEKYLYPDMRRQIGQIILGITKLKNINIEFFSMFNILDC